MRPAAPASHCEGADDAAAHADAVGTAEQADEEDGEIAGFRHGVTLCRSMSQAATAAQTAAQMTLE